MRAFVCQRRMQARWPLTCLPAAHHPLRRHTIYSLLPGAVVPDAWMTWFIGYLPQAVLGMVVTPILLFKLFPPEVRRAAAKRQRSGRAAAAPQQHASGGSSSSSSMQWQQQQQDGSCSLHSATATP